MEDDVKWFIAFFIIMAFFIGSIAGWEAFKLFHNVICFDQIGCVPAPWN